MSKPLKMILDVEGIFTVGENTWFASDSINESYGVAFEDDLNTGYFYAVDIKYNSKVLDALHIYNVADGIDKSKPCKLQIAWSVDGQIASLLINNYCHAIFDFENKAGYCRNGFPENKGEWSQISERTLTDELIGNFFGSAK